jgi:polar amino acid transport system substrate-binding protein
MMKPLSVLSLLLLFPVTICLAQTGKPIRVVEFTHLPFAHEDAQSKAAKGIEIAYLTDILKDLGYQPTFTFVPFSRMLRMLESGEADIGPFLTKTPEREVFAYYPEKPVLIMIPQLVVLKGSPLKQLKTPSDLKGLKIGFATGQTVPAFFKDSGLPPFDLVSGETLTQKNLNKLIGKRFDAFVSLNPTNLIVAAKKLGFSDAIRAIDIPDPGTMFYSVISKKSKIASTIIPAMEARLKAKKYDVDKYIQEEIMNIQHPD